MRLRFGTLLCTFGFGTITPLPAQVDMKIPIGLVVSDPSDPSTAYAGTPTGLLKSVDAGKIWTQQAFYPLGRIQPPVNCLAIGRSSSSLYVGTDRAHGLLWRSTDGGKSWQSSGAAFPVGVASDQTVGIEVSTSSTTVVYAQVKTAGGYQILRSTDSGASWTQTGKSPVMVAFYAGNPSLMYYCSGFQVFRSIDSGANWAAAGFVRVPQYAGEEAYSSVAEVDVSPLDSNRLVAVMTGPEYGGKALNGIFTSTDGGATWVRTLTNNSTEVRFNRQRPERVVAGDCCGNFSVYRSTDQGATWQELKINAASIVKFASVWLGFNPSDPQTALAPTATGVWKTVDGGATWTRVGTYRPTLVSDPDSVSVSLAAHGTSEVALTLNVRALEDATLAVSGYALTPVQDQWMSATAGKSSSTAIDLRLKSSGLAEGTYDTTVRVTATGFLNSALDIPVHLEAVENVPAAHFIAGALAGKGGFFDAMTVDPGGNLVVADFCRILRVEPDGSRTTLAGTGKSGHAVDGSAAARSPIPLVRGLAYDPSGILHFLDDDSLIWKIDRNGNLVRVVGSRNGTSAQTGSPALSSSLTLAVALQFDPAGVLYFATYSRIWRLRQDQTLEVIAGGGGAQTTINNVAGLATNAAGEILYSDSGQNRVRKVTKAGQVVTVAGSGAAGFSGDGAAAVSARLNRPGALAFDAAGNLYLADDAGRRVRRVRAADGIIESIAGLGLRGTAGLCSAALLTPLSSVENLAFLPDGTLAVNDSGNGNIYGVRLAAIAGAPVPVVSDAALNAASYASSVAPGSIFTLFGTALAGSEAMAAGAWPATLGGSTVCYADTAVPLYYVGPKQLSGQIPVTASPGQSWLRVFSLSGMSRSAPVNVAPTAPGVFMYGQSRAVAVNADGQINGPDTPAATGSWITVYLTGLGAVDNPVVTGQVAPTSPLSRALADCRVSVGGKRAAVYFAGLSPGFVGLAQVNAQVPDLPAGDHEMTVEIGGAASQPVLLKVQ